MKRLALLAVTAFMAVLLAACGDNAEKKVETNAASTVEQQNNTAPADTNKTMDNNSAAPAANDAAQPATTQPETAPADNATPASNTTPSTPATDDANKPAQ